MKIQDMTDLRILPPPPRKAARNGRYISLRRDEIGPYITLGQWCRAELDRIAPGASCTHIQVLSDGQHLAVRPATPTDQGSRQLAAGHACKVRVTEFDRHAPAKGVGIPIAVEVNTGHLVGRLPEKVRR